MKGLRYGLTLAVILAVLGFGSWLVFQSIQDVEPPFTPITIDVPGLPHATPDTARRDAAPPIVPPPPPPAPAVVPVAQAPESIAPAPEPWRPEPRQALRDSVYLLTQAGRDAEALALLDRWLADHPDDHDLRVEAARLRVRTGDRAGAWRDYERVLAATGDSLPVLAEYAAALLAAGEYPRAAERFAQLAARDPSNPEWTLGRARALAWGGRPREALAVLKGAPDDPSGEVAALRRRLRGELELTSAEAREWLQESPDDAAARLALARALAREGQGAAALAEYERLLRGTPDAQLYQEAAGVAAGIPDSVAAARLLGGASELAPSDTALRRRHAEALAWSGDRAAAIAVLDGLIAQQATPERLRTRAELRALTGDRAGAVADLERALALDPRAADHATLGDYHRWSGDRTRARAEYQRALALDPRNAAARAGLAQLRADAYRDLPWDPDEGLALTSGSIDDNEGFGSRTVRLGAGVALGQERRTVVSAGAEYRRVERERPGFTGARNVDGWGGDAGIAHRVGGVRLGARAGALQFTGSETVPTWALSAEGRLAGGSWRAGVAGGPAYETLRAGTTVGDGVDGETDDVLQGVGGSGTVNVPLTPRLELWSRLELLALDDDNERYNAQAALRYGLLPSFSALYSGALLAFADATATYWSPRYFTLHSLGLEYRRRWAGGLVLAAQGLAGVSWYDETFPGGPDQRGSAFQWSLAGEAGWQTLRWDVGVTGAYGTDRDGGYEAFLGTLRARYRW